MTSPLPSSPSKPSAGSLPDGVVLRDEAGDDLTIGLRWFQARMVPSALFAIGWNVFVVGWYLEAYTKDRADQALFGVFFLVLGLGMLHGVVAGFLNTSWFKLRGRALEIEHGPVPAGKTKRWDTTGWVSVYAIHSDGGGRRNRQSDRVELRAQRANFQEVTLATELTSGERAFAVAKLLAARLNASAQPIDPDPAPLPPRSEWGAVSDPSDAAEAWEARPQGVAIERLHPPDYEDEPDDPPPDASSLGQLGVWMGRSGWLAGATAFALALWYLPPDRRFDPQAVGVLCLVCLWAGGMLSLVAPLALGGVADAYVALLRRTGVLAPPVSQKIRAALPTLEADGSDGAAADQGFPVSLAGLPGDAADRYRQPLTVALWMPIALGAGLAWLGFPPLGMMVAAALLLATQGAAHAVVLGDSLFQDAEVLVAAPQVTKDRGIPMQLRITAARALRVERVEVRLYRRQIEWKEWEGTESARRRLIRHLEWEAGPQVTIPVHVDLKRHQALRLLAEVRIPQHFPLDQYAGYQRSNWVLQAHIDVPGWPDAAYQFRFAEVVAPETLRAPAGEGHPPGTSSRRPVSTRVATEAAVRCPYCGDPAGTRALVACCACETLHHQECWSAAGRCTTYACSETDARALTLVLG